MPVATQSVVDAYAHCMDPVCPGSDQEQVKVTRTQTDRYYVDDGGTIPGVNFSTSSLSFEDDDDRACPSCGNDRELSEQKRPQYRNESGQDPLTLLKRHHEVAGKVQSLEHDREVERLQRELADRERDAEMQELREQAAIQQKQIAELLAAVEGKANKPGRKPQAQQGN